MVVLMPLWFYDKADLRRSPSILGGIDMERESRYRREGARFIITIGTRMGLRYDTMATAVVYFHRFYMFHSFKQFPRYLTACCCLFLSGKVEETPKKCKDLIKIVKSHLRESQFAQFGDDPKEEVMTLERILLQTIKFDLQVDHPYGYLLKYAKCLNGDKVKREKMVQMAWTFINDSLCTTLCLQWEPEIIAIALMYLAGKLSKFEVSDWVGRTSRHHYWWDMFVEGMTIELMEDICHQVLDLYSTPTDTSQDSPPATPPTKSNIHRIQPTHSPSALAPPTAAAAPAAMSPAKPKEAVGQPIPRLEPGELKRKVSKSLKIDVVETKSSSRTSSSASQSKSSAHPPSPAKAIVVSEGKAPPLDSPQTSNIQQVGRPIETVYSDSQFSHSIPIAQTAESMSASIPQSSGSSHLPTASVAPPSVTVSTANQYMQAYSTAQAFALPDPGATYFATDGSTFMPPAAQYMQTASFIGSQPPGLGAAVQPQMAPSQHAQAMPSQYQDIYNSQTSAPPAPIGPQQTYVAPPPQMHTSTPAPAVGQYTTQQPGPVMMQPMQMPPLPPAPQHPPPPPMPVPSMMSMQSNPRMDIPRVPPPGPHNMNRPPRMGPPPPPPPAARMTVPSHFRPPRSELETYHHDGRGMDHSVGPRSGMSSRGGYYRDGPPRGPPGRSMPNFRSQRESEYDDYEDEQYSEYSDQGYGKHSYDSSGSSSSNMTSYMQYNTGHRPHDRGPPPPPRMEGPTGIPPVRITGSMNLNHPQ